MANKENTVTDKKKVNFAEFNKRVEIEYEYIRRHEYEQDNKKAWALANQRISEDYQVAS